MNSEVKSAGRVLDLLEFLAGCREPVSFSAVVAALGCPKSSAHALLQTLIGRGHVVQDRSGRYLLVEASRHGFPFRPSEEPLVARALPIMERLRDVSGETVLLSTMNARGDVRRLAKSVSRQPVRYDVDLQSPIAVYCTATGRALLAFRGDDEIEAYLDRVSLLSYTGFTVTDREELLAVLAEVRRRGYAINDQEFITGSTGVAAPIRDKAGIVIAALNLGTLTSRFREREAELCRLVVEAAASLSGCERPR
ncbi:IclR family transcriptional regulator [Aurantimonas sp. VKM B-3413]|uniref:IclR family transcriptional regulator n=1 Tax=Aurantimonas sp. VKM B-3413 TaxID=2779401 RepID=UPI001E31F0D2|nr:IclR family transcriptional regulator [Aurantimonas sp. VKM B-3413]MCB8839480.1 IclR family transcriptional regulator [Aurantimonas sp. VKM B-3413]